MAREPEPEEWAPVFAEYRELAGNYDQRWRRYVEASVRNTLASLDTQRNRRMLDVGCGTGVLLETLHQWAPDAELTGVDPVSEMLAVARERLPEAVRLEQGRAEKLPFADQAFDGLVSSSVFHFVEGPRTALNEMYRVLRFGGELVITDWCGDYLCCRLLHAWLKLTRRPHHRTWREDELREMLEDAGFEEIRGKRYRINWFWGLMTLRCRKPGQG